jgi:phytoene synthase
VHTSQSGKRVVVDVDLAKFFDRLNHDVRHDILIDRLKRRIDDAGVIRLILAYLNAGIMDGGMLVERHLGTPQGGPLSPLLANVLLDEVDKALEERGYSFARYADDILDDMTSNATVAQRETRLEELASKFFDGADDASEPVLPAVLHTARTYRIPLNLFDDFLTSMRMDLTVTDYPDRPAINHYMRGSAEVIGLQMLPILGTVGPLCDAEPYAEALGQAFQLTNFLRDINEDLDRNRVYLPADELAAFGVDRELLMWCHDNNRTDPRVRVALAAQHDTTRAIYKEAHRGIALLAPQSRPCVTTAFTLYSEILDRIEDIDFAVFSERASVGMSRRIAVFSGGLVRARRARRAAGSPRGGLSQGAA